MSRHYAGFFALLVAILFAGCSDTLLTDNATGYSGSNTMAPAQDGKLRHPQLLGTGSAGKVADESHVFVAFDEYEADGVTRRVLDGYGITRRVLEEYGITRRVLEAYGITRRIMDEYGVSRRVLEAYGITRRVLESYGITAEVLEEANYDISRSLLRSYGTSYKDLEAQGVTRRVLDDYGVTRRVLSDYNVSDTDFASALTSFERMLRLKVRIDAARPGIFLSLGALPLATFLDEIASDADIAFVEPDIAVQGPSVGTIRESGGKSELIPWGISAIGAVDFNAKTPEVAHVFLLDSGVLPKDLNLVESKDFSMLFQDRDQSTWDDSNVLQMPYFDPGDAGDPLDHTGHGSHLAGTIGALENGIGVVGAIPDVALHSLKVMSNDGRTDITTLLAAIDYVIAQKLASPTTPMLINLSLGMDIETTAYNVLDEGVERAIQNGIQVIVSAGNSGTDAATYSPAHVSEAITVGSFGQDNRWSSFSNHGAVVDLAAPGDLIASSSNDLLDYQRNLAVIESGTSMAAAHVTGVAAIILADNPNATPSVLRDALMARARPTVTGGPVGTTDLAVWAEPLKPGDGSSGSGGDIGELPPFYDFAITSGNRIDVYQETSLFVEFEDPSVQANASVFANEFFDPDNSNSRISGFSYNGSSYSPSGDVEDPDPSVWQEWMLDIVQPNYNPSQLDGTRFVDPIQIPELDISAFSKSADITTNKNLVLNGHYQLGTEENPIVWYVNGNVVTRGEVTFSGYGVILAKGTITINDDILAADGKTETSLGLYANNTITFKSRGLTVAAHVFTNSAVHVLRDLTLYGNITAGGNVAWKTQGVNRLFYREAPRALTDLFWPIN